MMTSCFDDEYMSSEHPNLIMIALSFLSEIRSDISGWEAVPPVMNLLYSCPEHACTLVHSPPEAQTLHVSDFRY